MMQSATIGILVGGHSRRMGRPKALIEVEGGTLIERTVAVARQVSDSVVLLGEPPFTLPESLADLSVQPDCHSDIGPMAGLYSLLFRASGEWCVLLSCDMPNLAAPLLRWIISEAQFGGHEAVVCATRDEADVDAFRIHPCCAAYRVSILPRVEEAIARRDYSMQALLARLNALSIPLLDSQARWVENWNAPEDVRREDECSGGGAVNT